MPHPMTRGNAGYWRGLATRRVLKAETFERKAQQAREESEVLHAIADRAEREGILIMPDDVDAPGVHTRVSPAA